MSNSEDQEGNRKRGGGSLTKKKKKQRKGCWVPTKSGGLFKNVAGKGAQGKRKGPGRGADTGKSGDAGGKKKKTKFARTSTTWRRLGQTSPVKGRVSKRKKEVWGGTGT